MPAAEKAGSSGEGLVRVQALDLLRLVAVLAVVLFHYGFRGPAVHGLTYVALPALASVAKYGFLGVSVFFVISGFVIAYSADGRTPTSFAIARAARIYPGFLFCMTLTFLASLTFGAPHFQATAVQWAANLFIAAPALKQLYMDSAYWSIVYELIFYGWIYLLMVMGFFRRRIDAVVAIWLCISLLNELVLGSVAIRKIFLTDTSGFFATGLMIYELYLGRRDAVLQCLLAFAVSCAVFQAVFNLEWLRQHSATAFDDWTVAAICLLAIVVVILAVRIRRLPIPSNVVIAIGGLTYPLYLLHQQIGYIAFTRIGPVAHPSIRVAIIIFAITVASWAIWRYVERPAQRLVKRVLSNTAARLGYLSGSRTISSPVSPAINPSP